MKLKKSNQSGSLVDLIRLSGVGIHDTPELTAMINSGLKKFKHEAHRQHGFRTESMFAYVAGALGQCQMIKQEDGSGICLLADEAISTPDYRIVLKNTQIFLVEVKNCDKKTFPFKKSYIDGLQKYALLNNCPLKIAIYWRKFKIWTLVSADCLAFTNQKCSLKIDQAMAFSEMAILGDAMIGTEAPLKIRLNANALRTSSIDENSQCVFTVGSVDLYTKDTLIADSTESNIAFQLIMSGRWEEDEVVHIENNKVTAIEYTYEPHEYDESQGFSIIGNLSSIISEKYDSSTISDGKIERLTPESGTDQFEVFIPENYEGKYLKLWQFILKPNKEYQRSA